MSKAYYLNFEDLTNRLFYILSKNDSNIDVITFKQVDDFMDIIKKNTINSDVVISFYRYGFDYLDFLNKYKDTFEKFGNDGIRLKEYVTPYNLLFNNAFLPLDIIIVLSDKNIEKETLNMMGIEEPIKEIKDIKYYIDELKEKIKEYSSKMEFEKCIELRERLYDLQYFDEKKYGTNNNSKKKTLFLPIENMI